MSINKINAWFERFGRFQIKHRIWFIVAVVVITAAGLAGLTRLKIQDDDSDWLDNAEVLKKSEDRYKELFGNEDGIAVLVQAPDVFDPEVLKAIDKLGVRLQSEVPYADDITSLTKLSISKGTEDGMEIVNPFEDGIPGGGKPLAQMTEEEKAELAEKKSFIMSRTSLINNLVSDDCTETWVFLSLLPFKDDFADQYVVGNAAIPIVESPEFQQNPKFTMKATGMSYTETEENRVITRETIMRVFSGFIVMLLCLILLVRSFRGVLVPLLATTFGIGTVLGYSGWLGIKGDSDLLTLPVLLGMALSVGYAIHYINAFRLEFRQRGNRKEAVAASVRVTGWPILFTVLTTIASFISFMGIGIGPLKWLGGISSAVVFTVYVYVILLLPVLYSYGKDAPSLKTNASQRQIEKEQKKKSRLEHTDELYGKFGGQVLRHRVPILIASAVITAVSIFGLFKITVNMDYVGMMGKKIPFVARLIDVMNSKLGNEYSYNIMIEYPEPDAFKNPEVMKALDTCSDQLGRLRLTKISGGKPRVTSVTSIVKELNKTLNGDESAYYVVPDSQDMLTQLLFLYEISGGDGLSDWVSEDYSTSHITVDLKEYKAAEGELDINDARRIAEQCFPGAQVTVIGVIAEYSSMNQKLVKGELWSFLGSFIIIALMLIIAFGSIRTGLIAMIPNVAPVLLTGGLMGFCGFPLDMLTMTVMPMILGMAVDDTIHFTNHVKYEMEQHEDYHTAIITSYKEIGRSMASSTLILCAMFLMYMFSPMSMLFRIGLLSIVGLGSALLADYTLTPILLLMTKPLGKEKKGEQFQK